MVAKDFLQDPQVRRWLDGVEPAWRLLTFAHMDLGYFGRGLIGSWPETDIGIVAMVAVGCGRRVAIQRKIDTAVFQNPRCFPGTWDRTSYAMGPGFSARCFGLDSSDTVAKRARIAGSASIISIVRPPCFDRMFTFDAAMEWTADARH